MHYKIFSAYQFSVSVFRHEDADDSDSESSEDESVHHRRRPFNEKIVDGHVLLEDRMSDNGEIMCVIFMFSLTEMTVYLFRNIMSQILIIRISISRLVGNISSS